MEKSKGSSEVVVWVLVGGQTFGSPLFYGHAGQVRQAGTRVVQPHPKERNLELGGRGDVPPTAPRTDVKLYETNVGALTAWLIGWQSSPSCPIGVHILRLRIHKLTAQHIPPPH